MTYEGLPPNAHNPIVQTGDVDVEAQYRQQIEAMNLTTPTPGRAARQLAQWGYREEVWDRWAQTGAENDTNHEGRALIAIARGDQRPLGVVYDEVRRSAKDSVDDKDLDKAKGVRSKYDPLADRTSYFF